MTAQQLATKINRAIRDNALDQLDSLLQSKAAPAALHTAGRSRGTTWELPLVYAAERNHAVAISKLLAAGAPLEATHEGGDTALVSAVSDGHFAAADVLIAAGADIHARSQSGSRLFDAALRTGNADWIERFAEGADFLYRNNNQVTALHQAAHGGCWPWIEKLLNATGIKVTDETKNGQRVLDFCRDLPTWQRLKAMAPKAPINKRFKSDIDSLWLMADRGAADIMQHLIDAGEKIDATYGAARNTLMHAATRSRSTATLAVLVKAGGKVNGRNAHNQRPLHWAAQLDNLVMVEALLAHGAKANVKTNSTFIIQETRTPLYFAAQCGNAAMTEALLEAGADPNDLCDQSNGTALCEAASYDELEVARCLLAHGANPNGVNRGGHGVDYFYFPLGQARSPEMVKLLLENGAQVNARNQHGEPAIKWLAQAEDPSDVELDALRALLAAGANPRERDLHGMTALSWAKSAAVTRILSEAMRSDAKAAPLIGEVAQAQAEESSYRRGINKW